MKSGNARQHLNEPNTTFHLYLKYLEYRSSLWEIFELSRLLRIAWHTFVSITQVYLDNAPIFNNCLLFYFFHLLTLQKSSAYIHWLLLL